MAYVYSDEDNAPMDEALFDRIDHYGHNPTVYGSYSEMKAVEKGLPFTDPKPDDGCWNCWEYDGYRCHLGWNNNDESYYNPDTDDKDPDDWCPEFDKDPTARVEDFFDAEHP